MIRQPPLFPQQNRPLPLWGRVGVGFSDAASVSFRPSVCQNHRHRYRACRCATTPILYALSAAIPPFADSAPSPHPATINPTPALRRVPRKMRPHFSWVPAHRGRMPIGGNWGDRSCIPPFSGRFCDCGKMANATPTPALPRGGGSRSAGIGATVPVSQTANSHFCNCRHSRNRTAPSPRGGGMGWGSAVLPRCLSVHPSARIIITGITPAFSPIYKAFLPYPLLQMTNLHRIRQQLTPPPPSAVGGGGFSVAVRASVVPSATGNTPIPTE